MRAPLRLEMVNLKYEYFELKQGFQLIKQFYALKTKHLDKVKYPRW